MIHIPVLQKEVIQYLSPEPNENFIDCTIDGGGHSLAILENNAPEGKILGIDWDQEFLDQLKEKIQNLKIRKRLILVNDSFTNLKEIVNQQKFKSVQGILFDLGMSSWQLRESGRGFSFQKNEPLDMRFNLKNPLTAAKIVNFWSEIEIEKILREFGEERFANSVAKEIIRTRKIKPIETTTQLVRVIKEAVPAKCQHQRIHFATRTFQGLRIAVNNELENLKIALPQALDILKTGGKIIAISFHSLEDRIVKNFFKEKAKENLIKILTKKPVRPSQKEIKINPHSRSSRLRAAIKI